MDDCVFCRIRDHLADNSRVYEDDLVVAFMDLYPVTPGMCWWCPANTWCT